MVWFVEFKNINPYTTTIIKSTILISWKGLIFLLASIDFIQTDTRLPGFPV